MKVRAFISRLIQLNTYSLCFLPDHPGQVVTPLPDDGIKELLYQAISNTWKGKS